MPSVLRPFRLAVHVQTEILTQPAYDLAGLRQLFEPAQAGIAYLNHAGMSPLPLPVKQAMIEAIEIMARDGSLAYTTLLDPMLPALRHKLGQLVGCTQDEVALVESTSMGLNLISHSLPLERGNNVLLCDTEFPSNVYPWQNLASKGIETRLVPTSDGGLTLEALDAKRDSHSRVVAVSAIQFFSGKRENLAELGRYCQRHNLWLIVDAMQAAGVVPIDMVQMGIHALSAGGQKAMLAPPGQGFIAIRSDLLELMQPIFACPRSVVNSDKWLQYDLTFAPAARRFDMGTSNIAGIAGMLAAVKLLLEIDPANTAEWVSYLTSLVIDDLEHRGYQVVTPRDPASQAHIVTFAVSGNPALLVQKLHSRGVILRAHEDPAGSPYLRISSHAYNTVEEVQRVGKLLEEINHE